MRFKVIIGALVGAILGLGFLVFSIWISTITIQWLFIPLAIVGWLIGGVIAGIIAANPGKGALAGALTGIVTFIISSIFIIIVALGFVEFLINFLIQFATFGQADLVAISGYTQLVIIGIGLLIGFILSLVSAIPNTIAGLLGGAINNSNRKKKDDYQNYPVS